MQNIPVAVQTVTNKKTQFCKLTDSSSIKVDTLGAFMQSPNGLEVMLCYVLDIR